MKKYSILAAFLTLQIICFNRCLADDWYLYEPSLTTEDLNFVDVNGFFAVGNSGVVLECGYPTSPVSEIEWTRLYPPTTENLYGVTCDTYVVGANGSILTYDLADWTLVDSPTNNTLYSVTLSVS